MQVSNRGKKIKQSMLHRSFNFFSEIRLKLKRKRVRFFTTDHSLGDIKKSVKRAQQFGHSVNQLQNNKSEITKCKTTQANNLKRLQGWANELIKFPLTQNETITYNNLKSNTHLKSKYHIFRGEINFPLTNGGKTNKRCNTSYSFWLVSQKIYERCSQIFYGNAYLFLLIAFFQHVVRKKAVGGF